MGLEARCAVVRREGRTVLRADDAAVLWEGDAFIVRGEARVKIAREQIADVAVRGAELVVRYDGGSVGVMLGEELAPKWRDKMLSKPKSRLEKLDIGQGTRVSLSGWTDASGAAALKEELETVGAIVHERTTSTDTDVILLLVERERDLAHIGALEKQLPDAAALWVVHPKGVASVADTRIYAEATKAQLTYVKVARFSDTLTAEKLVRPVALRAMSPASSRTTTNAKKTATKRPSRR